MIDTMGATLLFAGMALTEGLTLVTLKLAILWWLLIFVSPVVGHALARAALYAGVRPYLVKEDDLERVPEKYGLMSSRDEEKQD
jgi:multisubunit Na+/H+ antiporter MnhG subunit